MTAIAQTRDRWRMGVEARALMLLTAALLSFGLAVLYSASAIVAVQAELSSTHYLLRQVTGLGVGAIAFAAAAKMDAERWNKWAWPLMTGTILMLLIIVLPFTTSIAPRINGSRRFLFGASLQPSEIGKLAVIVWTAMLLVKKGDQMRRLTKGLLPFLVVIGVLDLLVVLEPDLSVAIMYTLVAGIVLFSGGVRIGQFVLLRMVTFLDPGTPASATKYQLWQSLIAVGSGGFFGRGFGEGRQSLGFVPFGYNDFIGSNIGEEWGFLGLMLLTLAFAVYAWLGFRIARSARSPFLQLVAIGLTVTVVTTAFLHIGVVVGLLPTTGLTLPFISYGRSNLVLSLFMTGMLVNIGGTKERVHGVAATDPLAAPAW